MCIWNMAADIYGFSDTQIKDVTYVNHSINRFMEATTSMGISACKGMGKTFLLKAKRLSMNNDLSFLVLPENQLVDTPGPIILGHNQIKFLSSYSNWVSLWIFCISAYILSQEEFKDICKGELTLFPNEIVQILTDKNDGVFHVLNKLIIKQNTDILRKAMETSTLLFHALQRINRQVVLFVDKIEEPFNRGYYKIPGSSESAEGKYNSSIWAYAQLAFAEAVYVIYSGRHHIKIYYSIRQEALYGGESISIEFSKIYKQMIAKIEYTYDDLKRMFDLYVKNEQDKNLFDPTQKDKDTCAALCGISRIKHRSGKTETMWSYIYRHSLCRPRDIMEMGITIYENIVCRNNVKAFTRTERIRECRHWVNQSATRICNEYLHGLEPFMGFDENIVFSSGLEKFLSNLPTNVFTIEAINSYCCIANKAANKNHCTECSEPHYFSALYNIGLLGYVYKSKSEKGYKNSIKFLGDSIYDLSLRTLPKAELYYVHPGVRNIIEALREKAMKNYVDSNIIINSSETFINKEQLLKMRHLSNALLGNLNEKRVFITSTERHMRNERQKICEFLEERGYEVLAFERPNFPKMPLEKQGKGATHDHCIDVALSCKYLIYIFDGEFGGAYAGDDYKKYIEENEVINIQPSISFMEYLVAKTYRKDVQVYVLKDVDIARGEYISNGCPAEYSSSVVESKNAPKVFAQLGYFNGLGNGTWFDKYSSINDLERYLDVLFPSIV